ncbi:unnamed protein product [Zymoseptoria tritici ST99CH_3D7]|uniref:Alcohol dehydrogenase-like N-terminal domain-containing protein n=1 Tax=Zymoseptoria tritici (strain ST99CH_3D7) TaxID=1276538 RepID=A0A1X7S5E5_ZYMT9|nr:unnamed protein product [Zymoseptoria tritici ST99CH_3D7]
MPKINVARLVEIGKPFEVGTADKPTPGPNDVLVKVEACCLVPNSSNIVSGGTDSDVFTLPQLPTVFGLDAAGVVEAVGERFFNIRAGDRTLGYAAVAIALGLGCMRILGIGRNKERLAELENLCHKGRVRTICSEDGGIDAVTEWVSEQTDGLDPDALYDCLGNGGDAYTTSRLAGTVTRGGIAVLAAGGAEGELRQTGGHESGCGDLGNDVVYERGGR